MNDSASRKIKLTFTSRLFKNLGSCTAGRFTLMNPFGDGKRNTTKENPIYARFGKPSKLVQELMYGTSNTLMPVNQLQSTDEAGKVLGTIVSL